MEEIIKCLWKKYAEEKDIKVDQVIPMQDMYNCVTCDGGLNRCPNYLSNVNYDMVISDYR